MYNHFKSFASTLLYFLIDSTITSFVIWPIWYFLFQKNFQYEIKWTDCVAGLFIFKMVFGNYYAMVLSIKADYDKEDASTVVEYVYEDEDEKEDNI